MEEHLKNLWQSFCHIIRLGFSIQATTDIKGTSENIRENISIRGTNMWMLISSCLLACIGLDTNSVAVIIGAMLISPLMSPIIGLGFSLGVHDKKLLGTALLNLGITIVITILTSTLYFALTPLGTMTNEIASRTQPTVLDVLIASFGGTAGIIACSRIKQATAIPGVAIATALMPPLCVTGFGLAKGLHSVYLGAFYLYSINAFFVSIATYVIVQLLNFPHQHFFDPSVHRTIKKWGALGAFLMILPSCIIFYDVVQTLKFNSKIESFLQDHVRVMTNREIIRSEVVDSDQDKDQQILRIFLFGTPLLSEEAKLLQLQLEKRGFENLSLDIVQVEMPEPSSSDTPTADPALVQKLFQYTEELKGKNQEISQLKTHLLKFNKETDSLNSLKAEIKLLFPEIQDAWYGLMLSMTSEEKSHQPTLMVSFTEPSTAENKKTKEDKKESLSRLRSFLQLRLKKKELTILEHTPETKSPPTSNLTSSAPSDRTKK